MKSLTGTRDERLDRRMAVARAAAVACASGLMLPLLVRVLGDVSPDLAWALDLAAHWQLLFLAGLTVGASTAAYARSRWSLLLFLLPLPWLSAWPKAPDGTGDGAQLVVMTANVFAGNSDPAPLTEWIRSVQPDVLAIVEISDAYARKLGLDDVLPYGVLRPRSDPFGLALLSRYPILAYEVVVELRGVQRIEAKLNWNGKIVTVVAFHPMPPLTSADHVRRNEDLARLTSRFAEEPTVILGDFNATPWSSAFAVPTHAGFRLVGGNSPTWPAAWSGLMGLPIDNVLLSRHWTVMKHETGPDVRSDHLPMSARIMLNMQYAPLHSSRR